MVAVYRPPKTGVTEVFFREFRPLFEKLCERAPQVIFAEDFNFPMGNKYRSGRFYDLLDLGLELKFQEPTYRSCSNPDYLSQLDLVLEQYASPCIDSVRVSELASFSDHFLVTFALNFPMISNKRRKILHLRRCSLLVSSWPNQLGRECRDDQFVFR